MEHFFNFCPSANCMNIIYFTRAHNAMHHHSLSTFQYPDNPHTDNVVFITATTRLILILICFNNNNNRHHAAAHPGGRGVPRGDPPHLRQPRRHHRGRGRHAPPLRRGPGAL